MTKKEVLEQEARIDMGTEKGWEEFPSLSPCACVLEREREPTRHSKRAIVPHDSRAGMNAFSLLLLGQVLPNRQFSPSSAVRPPGWRRLGCLKRKIRRVSSAGRRRRAEERGGLTFHHTPAGALTRPPKTPLSRQAIHEGILAAERHTHTHNMLSM